MIGELNSYVTGWVTYFRYAACRSHLQRLDEWIRRKLRCVRLKQRKRAKSIADFLQSLGVPEWSAWILALSGQGWWRKEGAPQARQAMSIAWFKAQGLVSLSERYAELQPSWRCQALVGAQTLHRCHCPLRLPLLSRCGTGGRCQIGDGRAGTRRSLRPPGVSPGRGRGRHLRG
jgi:hypothetical protein